MNCFPESWVIIPMAARTGVNQPIEVEQLSDVDIGIKCTIVKSFLNVL